MIEVCNGAKKDYVTGCEEMKGVSISRLNLVLEFFYVSLNANMYEFNWETDIDDKDLQSVCRTEHFLVNITSNYGRLLG